MPLTDFASFPDPLLTGQAVKVIQSDDALVNPNVARRVPSLNDTGQFPVYTPGDWARLESRLRGPGSRAVRSGFSLTTKPYAIPVYAVEYAADQQCVKQAAARGIDLVLQGNKWVARQMALRAEQLFFDTVMASSIWTTNWTGNTSASNYGSNTINQWNDTGSTPVEDIDHAKQVVAGITGIEPNVAVIGRKVWTALKTNAEFVARVQFGTTGAPAIVDETVIAKVLDLDAVYVARGIKNTAAEGDTPSFSFFDSADVGLFYVPDAQNAGEDQPASVYALTWNGYEMGPVGNNTEGVSIFEYYEPQTRSQIVSGELYSVPFVPAPDLGLFISGAVA